jgi:drug/metabolite transporter (DMT)-like permease
MNPIVALLFFWIILGFSPIIGKISTTVVNPVAMVLINCVLGFLFFLPFLIKRKELPALFDKKKALDFFLISAFGMALPFCVLLYALRYTTPANVAILNQAELLYALILGYVLLGEKPSAKQLLASALIVLGVTAILLEGKYSVNLKGDLMVVGCVWMFQISHIIAKKQPAGTSSYVLSAAKNIYAMPLLVIMFFIWGEKNLAANFTFDSNLLVVLVYFGIIRYGLSTLLWFYVIRRMYLTVATAIALSFPVLSLVISIIMGYDAFSLYKLAGLALTLGGAFMLNYYLHQDLKTRKTAV